MMGPGKDVAPKVSFSNAGTLIEKGDGVPEVAGTAYWMYTATKPVPASITVAVRVKAFDHPDNLGLASGTKKII